MEAGPGFSVSQELIHLHTIRYNQAAANRAVLEGAGLPPWHRLPPPRHQAAPQNYMGQRSTLSN